MSQASSISSRKDWKGTCDIYVLNFICSGEQNMSSASEQPLMLLHSLFAIYHLPFETLIRSKFESEIKHVNLGYIVLDCIN